MVKNPPRIEKSRRLEKAHRSTTGDSVKRTSLDSFSKSARVCCESDPQKLEGENHAGYRMGFSKPAPGRGDGNLDTF
jgi:hypothetical protein